MYSVSRPLSLSQDVSLLYNNLSALGNDIAYVSSNEIVIHSLLNGVSKKVPLTKKCTVYQASLVSMANAAVSSLLVAATSEGLFIYSIDKLESIFHLPLGNESEESHYNRGITYLDYGFICVGNSSGNVTVVKVNSKNENIQFFDNIETKPIPISCLGSSGRLVVAGNDYGDVFGFDHHANFEKVCKFNGRGFPCTSIVTREDVVIAAFTTGHIRIYRASINELAIEITAHGRCINGLALHPALDVVASVGEDQNMNVWSVPDFSSRSSREIDLLSSFVLANKKLTGVSFFNDERIGVVAYDDDEINFFEKNL